MKPVNTRKLVLAAVLIAIGVVCSPLSIPIGASRCFPVQHMVNVLCAVFLGPVYGVSCAFITSLIRVMIGSGTLLAFPGSMCGALLCGLVFHYTQKLIPTYLGELFGTSILGSVVAWPMASLLLGKEAAIFTYVLPFFVSSIGGVLIAAVLVAALKKTHIMDTVLYGKAEAHK